MRVDVADETQYREVSADTRRLLLSVRHGAGDDDLILGMRRNQIAVRVGGAARQAGLGPRLLGRLPQARHETGRGNAGRTSAGRFTPPTARLRVRLA